MYFAPCGGTFMTIYLQQEIHTKQKLRSVPFVNALYPYILPKDKVCCANEDILLYIMKSYGTYYVDALGVRVETMNGFLIYGSEMRTAMIYFLFAFPLLDMKQRDDKDG